MWKDNKKRFLPHTEMWKENKKRFLPHTEIWKIISYQKIFLKCVGNECGKNVLYSTGDEELLKCGRIGKTWKSFQTIQKSSTNFNVEDNFI